MKELKPPLFIQRKERRSGLNRRWIKTSYSGADRRSGYDRRSEPGPPTVGVAEKSEPLEMLGLEHLLVSGIIQLEAITRLLLEKGIVEEEELYEMIKRVQTAFQNQTKP
jgi:hypothetical protein